ncbi:MATE family efflux transporter [Proteocatella sphenisci]|uniref:MATE family efflux transporter n=1 Tax=Proteocatella sphenisci TaxID=181070 RepID=UPI0004B9A692|nr:MATE family efflux transporter [Proteocatella sphenisci]
MSNHLISKKSKKNTSDIKVFLNYAIPSITAMWVFSIYTMVDGLFVANYVGHEALAAINIAMPTINFIFALSLLFSTGTSTIIAISLGRKEVDQANKTFSINSFILIIMSFSISVLTILNLESLSEFLGATAATKEMIMDYLGIIICFSVFFIISYQFEVLVKTDGSPKLATIGVISSALTNVVLDYIFIVKFNFGVKGAAYATGISQIVSTAFFMSYFLSSKSKLAFVKFKLSEIKISIYKRIIPLGIADSLTELSAGITIFIFNQTILSVIGEQGVITYTIISYANLLVIMTMIGITQGMQPLVSYYLGKSDFESCKKFFKLAMSMLFFVSILVCYMSLSKTSAIISAFIGQGDQDFFNYSVNAFRFFSLSFLIVGFNILISGYFVSLEKPVEAIVISLARGFFVLVITLKLMVFIFGDFGIWIAPLVSESIVLVISIIFIVNYRKKTRCANFSELQITSH